MILMNYFFMHACRRDTQNTDECDIVEPRRALTYGQVVQDTFKDDIRKNRMYKVSALRCGLMFSGIVSGMYRKLRKMQKQLKRNIEDASGDHTKFHLSSYKAYMKAMKLHNLGTYDTALPGGLGRKVDFVETIGMMLNHSIHFQELLDQGLCRFYNTSEGNPDRLYVKISCDGAQMNKRSSVVTMTMSLLSFGSLIHSPDFNVPICHMLGKEEETLLRNKLTTCYEELNEMDGKLFAFTIPAPGIFYYARISIVHVYDLKYAYQAMGHVCWSSAMFPHLFCSCKTALRKNVSATNEVHEEIIKTVTASKKRKKRVADPKKKTKKKRNVEEVNTKADTCEVSTFSLEDLPLVSQGTYIQPLCIYISTY